MSLYYALGDGGILVQGKTYPYRDRMRALGAQYNAVDKSWIVPHSPENIALVAELCKSVGGGVVKEPSPNLGLVPKAFDRQPSRSVSTPTTLANFKTPSLPELVQDPALAEVPQGLSIAELMREAQLAIAQSFPRSVWVLGEIQNIRFHASGVYFQLADSKEGGSQSATVTVNATIWRSQHRELERKFGDTLKEILQDGFRVRVLADLTLFKDRGQLSLQIQSIDPNFTKGSLALQREQLLKELRAKGLLGKNKSLRLSPFPLKIGLLSAEDSRAKSDFIDQLQVYKFPGDVIFRPCQMQGEATLRDVVSGLAFLQQAGVDLIVMTRGGGSAADLRWFDSREIAFAIAECEVPVVAAIGHHEDVCVAEDICYQREKTPTAAADFIISIFQSTREKIDQLSLVLDKTLTERVKLFDAYLMGVMEKMRAAAQSQLSDQRRASDLAEAAIDLNWQRRLLQWRGRLDQHQAALSQGLDLRLERERSLIERAGSALQARSAMTVERVETGLRERVKDLRRAAVEMTRDREMSLQRLESLLKQRDPKPWMQQGWTQLFDEEGLIRESLQIVKGQNLNARLTDSLVTLRVEEIKIVKKG